MDAAGGDPAAPLTPRPGSPLARLLADPYRFDFFQAVRVLARSVGAPNGGAPAPPGSDPVRFRTAVGLGFPASPIADVAAVPTDRVDRAVFEVAVTFLGLTGPSGVLPTHYSEALLRLRPTQEGRPALWDWLDLFNHRLTALFYEAWAKYRPDVTGERAGAGALQESEFVGACLSLLGLGTPALRDRVRPPAGVSGGPPAADASLILHGGLFARHPRTAVGLESVLTRHLGVPVRVIQLVGRWLPLPASSQSRLGRPDGNAILGRTAVVGRRVRDVATVRVRVGPLTGDQFTALLPPADPAIEGPFVQLLRLVRFYLGPEFDFSVQLVPLAAEAPSVRLGQLGSGSQLGRNSWLRVAATGPDPENVIIRA
jgi:type VI secretion system protein ImpH